MFPLVAAALADAIYGTSALRRAARRGLSDHLAPSDSNPLAPATALARTRTDGSAM
jgi:hypothetical protein